MKKLLIFITSITFIIACSSDDIDENLDADLAEVKVPELSTHEISNISLYSINAGGKIIDSGTSEITELGIIVGLDQKPTIQKNLNKFVLNANDLGEFEIKITSIPASTTYYVRSYGISAAGIGYGNEVSFTSVDEKVYTGSITLSTQEEVVEFGANSYTTITGDLNIEGTVNDLSPLNSLVIINSAFKVQNTTELENFKGLENLKITGNILPNGFKIQNNKALTSFSGLNNLEITRGASNIIDNDALLNLEGLDSYNAASAGELRIAGCDNLKNLSGLDNLTFIGSILYIGSNSKLNDISALNNLETLGYKIIYIEENASLVNITGFNKIEELENLEIQVNNSFKKIDGFNNLKYIKYLSFVANHNMESLPNFQNLESVDDLTISGENSLQNLEGLKSITSLGDLSIYKCPQLINLNGLENLTSLKSFYIHSNDNLVDLSGLDNLKLLSGKKSTRIGFNAKLKSLKGIQNLSNSKAGIQIFNNNSLTDFCALSKLLRSGFDKNLGIHYNLENPTTQEIMDNCAL